jgi:hypothetical protein
MPAFVAFYAMEGGKIIPFQQKINGGAKVSRSIEPLFQCGVWYKPRSAVGFFIPAALRVGQQAKPAYDVVNG